MSSSAALRTAHDPAILPTVLLVDDDELMRMHLAAILGYEGYSVQTADCAREALQILERTPGCVVLADWEMPDMDGLALCRTIRALERDSYVYVLLLTIRCKEGDVVAGLRAGADDYLVKGVPIEELIARLECGHRIVAHQAASRVTSHAQVVPATAPAACTIDADITRRLAQDHGRCWAQHAPLAVLAFDIDYLECVAERFGADVSGSVLASIRTEVDKLLLECDWSVLLNGDVFLVVLPHATLDAARLVARKARDLVSRRTLCCAIGIPLTASVGIAVLEPAFDCQRSTPMSLIDVAVRCLQQSALQGGDCVTTAHLQWPAA